MQTDSCVDAQQNFLFRQISFYTYTQHDAALVVTRALRKLHYQDLYNVLCSANSINVTKSRKRWAILLECQSTSQEMLCT